MSEVRKSWTVYWHDQPFEVSDEEYTELRKLAIDDPVEANKKAKVYFKRELTDDEGSQMDTPDVQAGP